MATMSAQTELGVSSPGQVPVARLNSSLDPRSKCFTRGAEDRTLERQRDDQLGPPDGTLVGRRRRLIVDQPPQTRERGGRDLAGEEARNR